MWLENLVNDSYLFSPAATMGIENRIYSVVAWGMLEFKGFNRRSKSLRLAINVSKNIFGYVSNSTQFSTIITEPYITSCLPKQFDPKRLYLL
jgi:hypothetical protein